LSLYNTCIYKKSPLNTLSLSVSHLEFDKQGETFLATLQGFAPTIYGVDYSHPLCIFNADDYRNVCTMKNASFGFNDDYVLSGSDNGVVYLWSVSREVKHFIDSGVWNGNHEESAEYCNIFTGISSSF
jgi:hypothetical protein